MNSMDLIIYTDLYNNPLTLQQLQGLQEYRKITIVNDFKKIEEVYMDGKLNHILYYSQNENLNDIISNYQNNKIIIFHNIQLINGYKKSDLNKYDYGSLTEKSIQVENTEGELIFDSELDLVTGNHRLTKKYVYMDELDEYGDRNFKYIFTYQNEILHSIEVFTQDEWDSYRNFRVTQIEDYPGYFSWKGYEQYLSVEPIIPI